MSVKLYKNEIFSKKLYFINQDINQYIDNYNCGNESNQYSATKASNINDYLRDSFLWI